VRAPAALWGGTGRRHAGRLGLLATVIGCAFLLGACGSSGPSQSAAATTRGCQQVSAVLSDGPDPTADPVGYAEAQILPLRQVHTSQSELQDAIDALDAAYQQMYSSNGSAPAERAQSEASDRVNAICPGAAP
jgi:hypothetical protein